MSTQIIIYHTENGQTRLDVRLELEMVGLSQKLMAEIFQASKQNISLRLINILEEQELLESSVVKDFLITASDGKYYSTKFYNIDWIISVIMFPSAS